MSKFVITKSVIKRLTKLNKTLSVMIIFIHNHIVINYWKLETIIALHCKAAVTNS